jgi:hypothetical protein
MIWAREAERPIDGSVRLAGDLRLGRFTRRQPIKLHLNPEAAQLHLQFVDDVLYLL